MILFCLPPNITHVAQPLDVTPFHSLKSHWYNACKQYMSQHPGKIVTIYNFSKILSQAWNQTMTPRTIMAGFKQLVCIPLIQELLASQVLIRKELQHRLQNLCINKALNICPSILLITESIAKNYS